MVIRVFEKCWIDEDLDGKKKYGLREYTYDSPSDTFARAVSDLENNFDSDNIIESNDYFEDDCLDSIVIRVEIAEEMDKFDELEDIVHE